MKAKLSFPSAQPKEPKSCRGKFKWTGEDECTKKQVDQNPAKKDAKVALRTSTDAKRDDSVKLDWMYSPEAYSPNLHTQLSNSWPVDSFTLSPTAVNEAQNIDWLYDFSAYKVAQKQ